MKKIVALVLSLVMVLGLATTAFAAVKPEFWAVDANGAWAKRTDVNAAIAADADVADLGDLVADDDNYLACYNVCGAFYAEVTEAQATYKLTYGAKTVFLTPVDGADYRFEAKAVALDVVGELDDATCGEFYDTAFDEDYEYYVTYNKKGAPVAFYVAGNDNEDINVLVGGKLVEVEKVTSVAQLKHSFVGYDVVNYEYTTAICVECGKVAPLYANAVAAGDKAVKNDATGKWMKFTDVNTYGVASAPAAGETVESAKTFDAGIAMYVGMSVMAAAGSAVVLKKKD